MSSSMSKVQCLADALFSRILCYDALLYSHRFSHHALQLYQVGLLNVECQQLAKHLFIVYESVLQHLSITTQHVFYIECLQELSIQNNALGIVEHTNLVFQSKEVYTCFSAYRCINHRKQGGGYVDVIYSTFKC